MAFHDPGYGSPPKMDLPLDQAFWGQFFFAFEKKHWVAPMNFDFNNNCVCEFQNYTPSITIMENPRLSYISGGDGEEWANLDEKNAVIRNQWPG